MLFILIFLLKEHGLVVSKFFFAEDVKDGVLAVFFRLADAGIEPCVGKTVDYSVISVSVCQVSEEGLNSS